MTRVTGVLAGTFVAVTLMGAAAAHAGPVGESPSSTARGCTSGGQPCRPAPAGSCAAAAGFAGAAAGRPSNLPGACVARPAQAVQGADRYGYCSVAGNVDANGLPLEPGSFLNLLLGQPDLDARYTGATPGFFVRGAGVTCSLTPAQAAFATVATRKVNHTGGTGDLNQPDFYTLVG